MTRALGGYRGFSHPTHIPPQCLTRSPCLGELCPKTFLAGQVALSPVCHVSRKPVTTPDHAALWPRWALSLPGESWPGRGPQGDGPGSCLSYNWTRTFLQLKPQLEPIGCHRHSVPYEHLRGVSVDLCW